MNDNVEIDFSHPTKRTARGFSFTIPSWLKPMFEKYVDQLDLSKGDTTRFLKNYKKGVKCGKPHIQPTGINKIRNLAHKCACWIHGEDYVVKMKKKFTTHSFRRSAATALAETGISVVRLCHSGRWGSIVTAQEYQEYNSLEKRERATMLDGGEITTVLTTKNTN